MKLKNLFPSLGFNKLLCLISTGFLTILVAVYLYIDGFPYLLSKRIRENIALNNGTQAMQFWENLPTPLEFRVYLFNVTNPEEVTVGKRPILKEIGPYVYDQYRSKVDIRYHGNDMISYKVKKTFFFNQEKSGCLKESDMVTALNIPFLGTGYMVEERFPVGLAFLNSALPFLFPNISDIFLRVTVGQLLFSGVPIKCDYETGPAMPVCRGIKTNRPPSLREDPETKGFAFSMFQGVNATPSGVFKVYRGNDNIYNLGKIVEYNNLTYLSMWDKNSSCSTLRGTDSSIIPPVANIHDNIYLYLPEVCLSLRAEFAGESTMRGIHVYKYISAADNFASPETLPENKCRCRIPEDNPKNPPVCLKDGAIDATKCQGAPVVLTPPHFLNCDEEYTSYPEGLHPESSKHETQVYLEPNTGVPLAAYKRIQMNIFLRKLDGIDLLANVSKGLFPIAWVEEALPEEMVNNYAPALKELMTAVTAMQVFSGVLVVAGVLCLLLSAIIFLKIRSMACFRENQVVSNISFVSGVNPLGKDRDILGPKRGVFNIPASRLDNENISVDTFSGSALSPEMKSNSLNKKTTNPLTR